GQRLPASPAEELLVALVGELGAGDGHPAGQAAQDTLLSRVRRCLYACRNQSIDGVVEWADEETGPAGHPRRVTTAGDELLEPGDVGVRDPLVRLQSKEQGHIDFDGLSAARLYV